MIHWREWNGLDHLHLLLVGGSTSRDLWCMCAAFCYVVTRSEKKMSRKSKCASSLVSFLCLQSVSVQWIQRTLREFERTTPHSLTKLEMFFFFFGFGVTWRGLMSKRGAGFVWIECCDLWRIIMFFCYLCFGESEDNSIEVLSLFYAFTFYRSLHCR